MSAEPPEDRPDPPADETTEIPRPAEGGGSGEPPEGGGPEGEGGEGEPPEELRCANCDALLEPDQTYCLQCGAPTPVAPKLRRGGRAALIVAGALVILGLGAGALAWAVASGDGGGTTVTAVPTAGGAIPTDIVPTDTTGTAGTLPTDTTATAPTSTSGTLPTDTTGTAGALPTTTAGTSTAPPAATAPATTAATTTAAPSGGGASDWPAGKSGWTAVVASAKEQSAAQQKKTQLQSDGQPAGILFSSDYSSLNPGYYVVFSGVFSSQSAASAQAAKVRSQFPGAYPRQVVPK